MLMSRNSYNLFISIYCLLCIQRNCLHFILKYKKSPPPPFKDIKTFTFGIKILFCEFCQIHLHKWKWNTSSFFLQNKIFILKHYMQQLMSELWWKNSTFCYFAMNNVVWICVKIKWIIFHRIHIQFYLKFSVVS